MSTRVMAAMNLIHALPSDVILLMAKEKTMARALCSRLTLPEDVWLKLWERFKNNPAPAAELLSRKLTDEQVAHCIDTVFERSRTAKAFLLYNDIPSNLIEKVTPSIVKHGAEVFILFLLGNSLTSAEGLDFILTHCKKATKAELPYMNQLAWYAFKSGAETPTQELVEFIDFVIAKDYPEEEEFYSFYDSPENQLLSYLLDRRGDIASHFKGQTQMRLSIHTMLIQTQAVNYISATDLNSWYFNSSKEEQEEIEVAYLSHSGPNIWLFTPGSVPEDFKERMADYQDDPDRVTLDAARVKELMLPRNALLLERKLARYSTLVFRGLSAQCVDEQTLERLNQAWRVIHNPALGLNSLKTESDFLYYFKPETSSQREVFEKPLGRKENSQWALEAFLHLQHADVETWNLFLSFGENYPGSLKDLLKACSVLKN